MTEAALPAPAITVRGLQVARDGRVVLPDLDLQVDGGVITGLLGPSGSGKTTLMRCIVGVQEVRAGDVTVLGLPAGDPTLRHRVGYVTQAPSLYADLTVRENLAYFRSVLGCSATEIERVIDIVDLGDRARSVVDRLSGGERARASLAVALLGSPEVLVLDEPTVGLDPVLRQDLWTTFSALAATGTTLLVSSHVMDEAERCDRLILMREGAILAQSTVPDLLASTGSADVEQAFLALVDSDRGGRA